ncbi:MAG TPA: proline--tRNA ligase, partial [Candidatus Limnocylindria bacterium]|jgi:prolyl-tRNA synthetase|nr:proline--tRNA ligase [Candidatus Limnocylindria bacterium]
MRVSKLFFASLRDDPAEAEMVSHKLLVRAGYVRQLGSGIYSLLPLGFRVQKRIEQIIREEIDAIGGQEMEMPVVHPAELWKESGRYAKIGPELVRFKDRGGRDMVLAMTHEEVVADLLRDLMKSYRQMPAIVYHFQTKFRDEPRARGGLIRVREFVMKDSYSLDADEAGLDASYQAHHAAYTRIFERLGLHTVAVGADVGIMGGSLAHEFMVLNPHGEDTLVLCDACGYAANQQIAGVRKPEPPKEEPMATEEVATPGTDTIASLAALLEVGTDRTAKATFFVAGDGRLITAVVRGDFEVNETKLVNAVKAVGGLRPATVEEIRAAGMEPGYASPIGAHDTTVVVDELVARSPNLVAGANRAGFHLRNVNAGRDFTPDVVADITNAREGDACPRCGAPVRLTNGIEVGNIFKLGTDFTERLNATYLAEDGSRHHVVMGSYGIGLGRAMACIVEEHHDEKGIVWPAAVAPFVAQLVTLSAGKEPAVATEAEALYQRLADAGTDVLYDDRDESPGVKLTDAELLGMPWIVTISPRSLAAGGAEVTERATGERGVRPISEIEALLR